jgi:alpha-galactosidase
MSLWAISAAPLIVGADVTKLTKSEIAILTNPEVLAVNQDPLGLQCIKIPDSNSELQVWAKPLAQPGSRAIVLLNRTAAASPISVDWSSLELDPAGKAQVRDLWAHKNLGLYTSRFQVTVPPQDIVMLRIDGEEGQGVTYSPSANHSGAVAKDDIVCKDCLASEGSLVKSDASESFQDIKASSDATYITIEYRNLSGAPIVAELRANGQIATRVQFLPTSRTQSGIGAIMVEVNLDPTIGNVVEISSPCIGKSFSVASLKVSPW